MRLCPDTAPNGSYTTSDPDRKRIRNEDSGHGRAAPAGARRVRGQRCRSAHTCMDCMTIYLHTTTRYTVHDSPKLLSVVVCITLISLVDSRFEPRPRLTDDGDSSTRKTRAGANSTATRQLLDRITRQLLDSSRQTSTEPPLTACDGASRCQARQLAIDSSGQLDRPRQTSTD